MKRLVAVVVVAAAGVFAGAACWPPPPPGGMSCNPNNSGGCVPNATHLDFAGGSGDGPEYVVGPVQVIGSDVYGLDHDGDGVGCE